MEPGPERPRVIVVMPAYNAGPTLERTYAEIPPGWVDRVILVDDCSRDDTVLKASQLQMQVICHPRNLGYGGNQKTCYRAALEDGAEIVIMLHPDYQYDPKIIPDLVRPIAEGRADVVFASRFLRDPLSGGMPRYKYYSNRLLTWLQNRVQDTEFSEFHTGYRAFSRKALESVPFERNSDGFVFDNQIVGQLLLKGARFTEVPVDTRYEKESSTVSFTGSLRYGLEVLWTQLRFLLHRRGIRRSPFLE